MPLIRLEDEQSPWPDIRDAAKILWLTSSNPDINALRDQLKVNYLNTLLSATDLHTGINGSRKAVLVASNEKLTIAFEGSAPGELIMNTWANAKGPNWWDIPYPVFTEGNRVHSFFRDMWYGMRAALFEAFSAAIQKIVEEGAVPKQIIVTGFSMGGGVSTMAFTDILEHVRFTYGSQSSSPQAWAVDSNLGSLIQHLTFAAVAAADEGFHTVLNNLYERYSIRAWDFMNHKDWTRHTHDFAFRSWRGHRYILPDAVVRHCEAEFGPQAHFILGYLKAAEWIEENGTEQVESEYSY